MWFKLIVITASMALIRMLPSNQEIKELGEQMGNIKEEQVATN